MNHEKITASSGYKLKYQAPFLLSLLTLCMIAVIEYKLPFFFLHGDNLHQTLPYYVHNVRAITSGEIPLFNFNQFLGTPILSCIQSAAFYPPNYIGVMLSQLLLGNYYGTMEFVASFHLVIATVGFYQLMRDFSLNSMSSSFGAIAWTFCGFVTTVGNSWIHVLGYAAYFPWILLYSIRQMGKFELRGFVLLVFLRCLALFIGYIPYFIYTVTFDAITVTLLFFFARNGLIKHKGNLDMVSSSSGVISFIARQTSSYLCVFLLATPLLFPALHQIGMSADRKAPFSRELYFVNDYDLLPWLNGLLSPFYTGLYSWCEQPYISHIGWLTVLFCGAALWQRGEEQKKIIVFLVLAVFSLLWASGSFVMDFFYHIPLYNRQRNSFKLAFFTSFYLVVTASFGFEFLCQRTRVFAQRHARTALVIVTVLFLGHVGNFLWFHTVTPQRNFIQHFENVPYEEPLKEMLKDGRMVSIVPAYDMPQRVSFTMPVLGFNYATLFGLYHFAGYETLVSDKNLMASKGLNYSADFQVDKGTTFNPSLSDLEYCRKWGVKWYVVDKKVQVDPAGVLKLVHNDDKRVVMLDAAAMPFVHWHDNKTEDGVSHSFSTNSIRAVTDRQTSGRLIVNVLYNPFFKATIDGDKTEITETSDMQMLVTVPPGRHAIKITYSDPYFTAGLLISGGFMVFLIVGGVFYWAKVKRRPGLPADLI